MRIPVCILVLATVFFQQITVKAAPDGGVHIIVLEQGGMSDWEITEFIDNSLIEPMENGIREVPSYVSAREGESAELTLISVNSQPLIVFHNEELAGFENRIAEYYRAKVAMELRRDSERGIIEGLFQVPMWPYIAASEVSTKQITTQMLHRIQDYLRYQFPSANYAGTGDFKGWDVLNTAEYGFYLYGSGRPGEGSGVVSHYLFNGNLKNISVSIPESVHLSAVFIAGEYDIIQPAGNAESTEPWEILGPRDEFARGSGADGMISELQLSDDQGKLARSIFAPMNMDDTGLGQWQFEWRSDPEGSEKSDQGTALPVVVIICWLVFGFVVLAGNWIYRFNSWGGAVLLIRTMALYPVYLLISLLAAGFWGLGFIASAALIARFLAPEGKRVAAAAVIIFSSFVVMFTSWVFI